MKYSRRQTLALGLGGLVAAGLPVPAWASKYDEVVAAFTGGASPSGDGISLSAPEIAENGNNVPVTVEAPGAVAIMLLASGNPTPGIATFTFGPGAGSHMAATRVRLATTQDVVALAKMPDGSIRQARATVKVTIGGCGG
jgi:sulfur-oxidizing protein SoxY